MQIIVGRIGLDLNDLQQDTNKIPTGSKFTPKSTTKTKLRAGVLYEPTVDNTGSTPTLTASEITLSNNSGDGYYKFDLYFKSNVETVLLLDSIDMGNTDFITNALRFGFTVDGEDEPLIFSKSADVGAETRTYYGINNVISDKQTLTGELLDSENPYVDTVIATKAEGKKEICSLTANEAKKVTVCIWLEGQDKDCIDEFANGGQNNAISFSFGSTTSST